MPTKRKRDTELERALRDLATAADRVASLLARDLAPVPKRRRPPAPPAFVPKSKPTELDAARARAELLRLGYVPRRPR